MKDLGPDRMRKALASTLALSAGMWSFTQIGYSQTDEDEEDIFELSPFEVTAEANEGYRASSTLAGTRIRTDLKDVGSAISVYTEQFLQDVGATDTGSLLQYTTNTEVGGTQGTYGGLGNGATLDEGSRLLNPTSNNRVRGLDSAENTRDFFVSDIPWDSYNVDRIDIQRGPNSILFGLGSPAGIINATLADAALVNEGQASIRFGSYGSLRGSVSVNRVLMEDTLAVRFSALMDHEQFQQDPAFEDDERIYGAVRWEPKIGDDTMRTTLKAKFEHGQIDANRPRTVTPIDGISPWFRPVEVDEETNPFGGMGQVIVPNAYAGFGEYTQSSGENYIPWLSGAGLNQQHPFWLFDGGTGDVVDARAGWINNGARDAEGNVGGSATGLTGKLTSVPFLGVGTLNTVATSANLPLAQYGQYRAQSMTDPTVFDFYNTLIDGPTKGEFEEWDAYNLDASQTWFSDRLGVQLIYDKQDYIRGGEALLGYQPQIQIDTLATFDDLTPNPNVGRPYVATGGGGGSGSSYESDREYMRASLFGELRASDFMDQDTFLARLLGKHRLNGVYSDEDYQTENLGWQRHAATQDWYAYWTGNAGNSVSIAERAPTGFIYLGDSLIGRSSASGANIPGINAPVDLRSGSVTVFDTVWNAEGVPFDAPWTVPDSVAPIFNLDEPPEDGWMQHSNPANYVGWNDHPVNLMSYNMGADPRLLRRATLSQRETQSYAATWQGYWWDGAIVTTLGWREDEVKSRGDSAVEMGDNRNILDLSPDAYGLPSDYDDDRIFKDDSTSGGVVVHLNQLLDDRLPLNVSLSYNESSNFQVTDVRNDLYGNPIANPTGETTDYGLLLSTKDNKYSFRVVKYESTVSLANSSLESIENLGATIREGMNWRNVFLYDLALYNWDSRGAGVGTADGYRNTITNAYPEIDPNYNPNDPDSEADPTAPEAYAFEDAMISSWNEIQGWLTERGFFEAWGFTPQALSDLTDRSTYEADPEAWTPSDPSLVYQYGSNPPQNFTVTADTQSEGYEFEFTANPTENWRIAINASRTEASRTNVGGDVINEFVAFMDEMLLDPSNTGDDAIAEGFTPAGAMPRWGNPGGAIGPSIYSPWRANYIRMRLQEGTAAPELREWRYNIITNYSFSDGMFKGVDIGGSYRWQDEIAIGYPLVPGEEGQFTFDIDNPVYGPSEDFIDLWAGYSRALTDNIDWRIQLNIRNAFADEELIPVSVQPDNSTWAGLRMAPVQEWFITNTFSF